MDSLCHVRNIVMFLLSWRTVSALTRVLFLCLFHSLLHNSGNKHKNNTLVSAETVHHSSTYIILYFCRGQWLTDHWLYNDVTGVLWRPNHWNNLQWKLNQNSYIFVWKMVAILSWPQCVKYTNQLWILLHWITHQASFFLKIIDSNP